MKTTLRDILKERNEHNLLLLKKNLNELKKEGELFFKEDIDSLEIDTEFEMFHSFMPSSTTTKTAFPISYVEYKHWELEKERIIKENYEDYFSDTISKTEMKPFSKLHKGKVYGWVYQ